MNQISDKPLPAAMAESFAGANCANYLLGRYGATMSLRDVAVELGSTPNALRIRQLRCGDLPPRIPGVRGYRWPTITIASWISGLSGAVASPSRFDGARETRPRGRPRRRVPANGTDVWGAA